ncbi:MAG: hypothetical protein CL678_06815 [Bdellovibrionaceae bacterium]|nr:hypothetical protein [Pseudobdellovibrionaceae bacterium]|tara:strand:- start:568 stop:1326 length:759 start_codon:yes stop_codon:yes gene_type:complete
MKLKFIAFILLISIDGVSKETPSLFHFKILNKTLLTENEKTELNSFLSFFLKELKNKIDLHSKENELEISLGTIPCFDQSKKNDCFPSERSGYFYPGTPKKIYIKYPRKNFNTLFTDIIHETQHWFHYQFAPDSKWEVQEGLSLWWEFIFFKNWNSSNIQAIFNSWNSENFWNFEKKERADYGKLYLVFQNLFSKKIEDQKLFLNRIYKIPLLSLEEIFKEAQTSKSEILTDLEKDLKPLLNFRKGLPISSP